MKKMLFLSVLLGTSLAAQAIPELAYDATDILKLPDNIHLGEAAGVATNSKGHIFVYTRTGAAAATVGSSRTFYKAGSRLFEFDQTGKYLREIGSGLYGLNFAQQVRIDPQDNIWLVDQGSSNVMKFDPEGRLQLVLSRKPEAISVRPVGGGRRPRWSGRRRRTRRRTGRSIRLRSDDSSRSVGGTGPRSGDSSRRFCGTNPPTSRSSCGGASARRKARAARTSGIGHSGRQLQSNR
jgi:hypothetical protein